MDLNKHLHAFNFVIGLLLITSFQAFATDTLSVVKAEDVQWSALNPQRGDNSPQAGKLWGDREQNGVSGFLVKFKDGFSSPPHIHNVGYRGVVISGEIHNDDPKAANFWMGTGSFWTQPAGESHITSARGEHNVAYIEIDKGPYLVWPAIKAFDNGDRPVNIEARNVVWQSTNHLADILLPEEPSLQPVPEISYVWGKPGNGSDYGMLLRLPILDSSIVMTLDQKFRGVLISGELELSDEKTQKLAPGSYFGSESAEKITIKNKQAGSIIYIKTGGKLQLSVK